VVGILGRTGSGKSTLARLVTRLYDPRAGAIRVSGIDLRDVDRTDRRARIAMVTQEVQLFRATVRENLTFFDASVDDARLWEALNDLGVGEWVASLPQGLDTMLESGSGGLSAGQAQLLAFARVFLGDPGLVILDEASSRLDPATEVLIERAVDRLLTDRTGLIIAHRLATVDRADDILILERGRLVEFGERDALAEDPKSRFSTLLRTGMEELLA
jgi:ATP-binding cassette, subfamily B, bacterial